jgi:hypothetical protein
LQPITQAQGWTETFSFSWRYKTCLGCVWRLLAWRPDRFGAFRVIVVGALLYAAGWWAWPFTDRTDFPTGVLIGAAQAG